MTRGSITRESAMQLELHNRQAGMDKEDASRVERLLRLSLGRFNGTVSRVKVTLSDMNGPKGGVDKRCVIAAKMKETGQVVVQGDGLR